MRQTQRGFMVGSCRQKPHLKQLEVDSFPANRGHEHVIAHGVITFYWSTLGWLFTGIRCLIEQPQLAVGSVSLSLLSMGLQPAPNCHEPQLGLLHVIANGPICTWEWGPKIFNYLGQMKMKLEKLWESSKNHDTGSWLIIGKLLFFILFIFNL